MMRPSLAPFGPSITGTPRSPGSQGYYLFYAAPYVLTLALLIATSSPDRALTGAPGELSLK